MMTWGCITVSDPGDLSRIHETLNSNLYLECLNDYVLASFEFYDMDPSNCIFQHDNSRVHTARIIQGWLEQQEFTVLKWPPNSPDLNIIEHIWEYLKDQLNAYPSSPKSLDELWERVQDIWTNIPIEKIERLYESMPKRMTALVRSRGGYIKY